MFKKRQSERIQMLGGDDDEQTLIDLSKGGVCCYHDRMLKKGDTVAVTIRGLTVDAKVIFCARRSIGFRLGLQFLNVGSSAQNQINELVERFSRGVPLDCAVSDGAD